MKHHAWIVVLALLSCAQPPVVPRTTARQDGAWLVIEADDQPMERRRADGVAAWLLWGASSHEQRRSLLESLDELDEAIVRRANPLALDLGEEGPAALRDALQASWLPRWTAARSLVRGSWRTGAGTSVRAVFGPKPSSDEVRSLWRDTGDTVAEPPAELARLAAWPVAYAQRIRCVRQGDLGRALDAARTHPSTALVVTSALAAGQLPEAHAPLQSIARRLARRLSAAGGSNPLLDALASDPPPGPWLDWLQLRSFDALVVPRLGGLAGGPLEWSRHAACRVSGRGRSPS